jgi:hypothetical protein
MTKCPKLVCLKIGKLEFIWDLACLREVPPCGTKAGACDLVLITVTFKEDEQFTGEMARGR